MFKTIIDPSDEVISFIQNMRELENEILVDSEKLVLKFIEVGRYKPINLYLKESLLEKFCHAQLFSNVFVVKDTVMNNTSGYKFSKGILATFQKPDFIEFSKLKPPYVFLNGLTSPENVGSIVRTITGLGFSSLIIDSKTCSPFLRRCIRVSMGNINFLDVHKTDDISNFLKLNEVDVYCAANEEGSRNFTDIKPTQKSAFIIGSEGHGIDRNILDSGHPIIKIPIQQGVLHFNASVACAIIASDWSQKLNLIS
jgi:tRNA G18 (ribose-2'-O)-methylase SpoU